MEETPEKAVFDIFDRGRQGLISKDDAVQALRVSGQNPTQAEVATLMESYGDEVSLAEFTEILKECKRTSKTSKEEVNKFFDSLTKIDGEYVEAEELKKALMSSGDALSEAEINQVFQKYEGASRIKVSEFINEIFN